MNVVQHSKPWKIIKYGFVEKVVIHVQYETLFQNCMKTLSTIYQSKKTMSGKNRMCLVYI